MKWVIITSTLVTFSGCASTTAPNGWLPYPEETTYDSRGCWIDLRFNDGKGVGNSLISMLNNDNGNIRISGELIAIHEDSCFILVYEYDQKTTLTSVFNQDIVAAKIGKYDYDDDKVTMHALYGTGSAVTHGWYGILSAPIWIISGILANRKFSNSSIIKYHSRSNDSWTDLRIYSRFPGGVPKSLNRKKINNASRMYIQSP